MTFFSRKGKDILVGISDLHGCSAQLDELLHALGKKYGIIKNNKIINARLVFLGDYINKGDSSIKVIQRIDALKTENPHSVATLIGNHEIMAIKNYERASELLQYRLENNKHGVTEHPEEKVQNLIEMYSATFHGVRGGTELIKEFSNDPDEAFSKYLSAIAPGGFLNKWINSLLPFLFTDYSGKKILFSHADLPFGIKNVDEAITFYKTQDSERLPTLGYFDNQHHMKLTQESIDSFVDDLGVDYVVTAHTTHEDIKLLGRRLFRLDTGLYRSTDPKALIFKPDGAYRYGVISGEKKLIGF